MKIFNSRKTRPLAPHLVRGQQAEQRACEYLIKHGMTLVCSNYRCRLGEVDLIMKDDAYFVFVEVRYRSNSTYGGALASIGPGKVRRLRAAANHYLQRKDPCASHPCRFDVIVSNSSQDTECTWIKNAF